MALAGRGTHPDDEAMNARMAPRPVISPRERALVDLERQVLMGPLCTVADLSGRKEFGTVRRRICESGTDCLRHFGNGYVREGGLALQQNPDEFAALCLFLGEHAPLPTYVEIGSGSGGAGFFLARELGFENALSIDDGAGPRAAEQNVNLAAFQRFVGNSHSPEARSFLKETLGGRPLDLAFIDGDHSQDGAWKDIELVLAFSAPGTLVVLHDTRACFGVEVAWLRAIREGLLTPLAEFVGSFKPLGIGVSRVP